MLRQFEKFIYKTKNDPKFVYLRQFIPFPYMIIVLGSKSIKSIVLSH